MSSQGLKKTASQYRQGDDWRSNFRHINYPDIEVAIRKVLTTREPEPVFDRLGNHTAGGRIKPLSIDEQIFRIAVLMETQAKAAVARSVTKETSNGR